MKIKAMILTAVLSVMMSAVCFAKTSPDESMKIFCNAFFYLNDADLKILNSSHEKMRETYTKMFEVEDENLKFTPDQKNKLADALIEQMQKKIKFTTKTESVSGDKAVVAVTITGIKFNEALNSIELDASVDEKDLTKEKIAELVANEILNRIKNIQQKNSVTVKFNCTYNSDTDMWLPEDDGENNLNPLFEAAF